MFFFDLALFHNSHVKLLFLFDTQGTTFRMSSFSLGYFWWLFWCWEGSVGRRGLWKFLHLDEPAGRAQEGRGWMDQQFQDWSETHTILFTFTQSQFYQILSLQQSPRKCSISDQTDHKIGSKLCHISFMKKLFRSENKETIFLSSKTSETAKV